jgi:hypothetical protein
MMPPRLTPRLSPRSPLPQYAGTRFPPCGCPESHEFRDLIPLEHGSVTHLVNGKRNFVTQGLGYHWPRKEGRPPSGLWDDPGSWVPQKLATNENIGACTLPRLSRDNPVWSTNAKIEYAKVSRLDDWVEGQARDAYD